MCLQVSFMGARIRMRSVPQVKPPKQWYVLACEVGYIGNVFELFNNSPRRPRLMVTDDLQQAVIGTEGMICEWRRLGREVLGVDSEKVPVRCDLVGRRRRSPGFAWHGQRFDDAQFRVVESNVGRRHQVN